MLTLPTPQKGNAHEGNRAIPSPSKNDRFLRKRDARIRPESDVERTYRTTCTTAGDGVESATGAVAVGPEDKNYRLVRCAKASAARQSISNISCAPASAVMPPVSKGGETSTTSAP